MSEGTSSPNSRSAISSQESEDGLIAFAARGGPIVDLFGQEVVHADRSRPSANWNGSLTSGTFGRLGFISSASESLQSSLESRLRQRLNGSDLCEVTWKRWDTPWGQRRSKPRARVRSTSEIDIGLWPTATSTDAKGNAQARGVGAAAAHPKRGTTLAGAALWSTASARDWKDTPGMAIQGPDGRTRLDQLPRQAQTAEPLNGISAQTGKSAPLNPEFVSWLMGYPQEWVSCGVSAMQSIRGRR